MPTASMRSSIVSSVQLAFSPQTFRPSEMISVTVRRGLSDEIGSWKIIWNLRAHLAHLLVGQLGEVLAFEPTPNPMSAWGVGSQRERSSTCRNPTRRRCPSVSPSTRSKTHVGHCVDRATGDREFDDHVLDAHEDIRRTRAGVRFLNRPSDEFSPRFPSSACRWRSPPGVQVGFQCVVAIGRADGVEAGPAVAVDVARSVFEWWLGVETVGLSVATPSGERTNPGAGRAGSGGRPGIGCNRVWLRIAGLGIDCSSAWVYGWRMSANRASVLPTSINRPA